jgi:hypothetical protein
MTLPLALFRARFPSRSLTLSLSLSLPHSRARTHTHTHNLSCSLHFPSRAVSLSFSRAPSLSPSLSCSVSHLAREPPKRFLKLLEEDDVSKVTQAGATQGHILLLSYVVQIVQIVDTGRLTATSSPDDILTVYLWCKQVSCTYKSAHMTCDEYAWLRLAALSPPDSCSAQRSYLCTNRDRSIVRSISLDRRIFMSISKSPSFAAPRARTWACEDIWCHKTPLLETNPFLAPQCYGFFPGTIALDTWSHRSASWPSCRSARQTTCQRRIL